MRRQSIGLQLVCVTASLAVLVVACNAFGQSSARTQNFVVRSINDGRAAEYADAAEKWYAALAKDWYGEELPPLSSPAQIDITANGTEGGGATSYVILGRRVEQVTGTWQGKPERLLDAVIPHEVFHVVNANRFGYYLPRWIDEGICTTVESREAKKICYWNPLYKSLQGNRGIPFNQMLAAREYPRDIATFYAQSWSTTEFLLRHGGKPKMVSFVDEGCKTDNWHAALKTVYGYTTNDLQEDWTSWLAAGMPEPTDRVTVERWNRSSQRWGYCDSCTDGGATVGGVMIGRVRLPNPPQESTKPVRDPELKAWLVEVRDRLVEVNERLDGIKSCECEERTAITAEDVAAVLVKKYPDKIRGPRGDKGEPGRDGASGSDGISLNDEGVSHATLVVDQNATYWPRLSVQLERAKQRFSPIRIAPPPQFATELPAIVFYRKNGTSFIVRKGEREVTHTLTAIERGELSFLQES